MSCSMVKYDIYNGAPEFYTIKKYVELKYKSSITNIISTEDGTCPMWIGHINIIFEDRELKLISNIQNKNRSPFYTIITDDLSLIRPFFDYISRLCNVNSISVLEKQHLFVYNQGQCCYIESEYKCSDAKKLACYEEYETEIERYLKCLAEKKELMKVLGAQSGKNFLMYGPPGVGKTSFAKYIAHKHNLAIFIVPLGSSLSKHILNPTSARLSNGRTYVPNGNPIIVLIEDFDRVLSTLDNRVIPELLNSLDGIANNYGVMRLFSANATDVIENNEAVLSRMTSKWYFDIPSLHDITSILLDIFPGKNEQVDIFSKNIESLEQKVSIRDIFGYLQKFIIFDDPLLEANKSFNPHIFSIKIYNKTV